MPTILIVMTLIISTALLISKYKEYTKNKEYKESFQEKNMNPVEGDYFPIPSNPINKSKPFSMTIVDIFQISGYGKFATGQIETGVIAVGDKVIITKANGEKLQTTITGIETLHKSQPSAEAGMHVGLAFQNSENIETGDNITKA